MAKDFSQTKTKEIHPGTPGSQLKLNVNPYASERFAHQARSANLEQELSNADSDMPILFLESSDQSAIDHSRLAGFRAGNMLDFKIKTVPKSKHNIHKSNFPEFIKNLREFYLQFRLK